MRLYKLLVLQFFLLAASELNVCSNERISLRIQSENKDVLVHAVCPSGSSQQFVVEHLRPFQGRLLRQLVDVFSLDECARRCAQASECAGANFMQSLNGDPLCTLHTAEHQGEVDNQSPLVVIFGITRFCAGDPIKPSANEKQCTRPWTFQKYARIEPSSDKFQIFTLSAIPLLQCMDECRKNPDCASAVYSNEQRKCRLSRVSPQNVHGLRNYFRQNPDWDTFESNCPPEQIDPSNCGFSRISQAGFLEPFTAILLQIRSPEECQKACLSTLVLPKSSTCRSWTHDSSTGRCFLSHLALRGLGRNVLEQMGASLSSGELDECMSFRLDCRANSLLLFGHSPLKLFRGFVRSKRGKGRCERPILEAHKFTVDLPFVECGFEKRSDHSHWGTLLVKEGSTELITGRDKVVQANCRFHHALQEGLPTSEDEGALLPSMLKVRLRVNDTTAADDEHSQQSVSTRVIVLPPARQKAPVQKAPGAPQYRLEVLDALGRPVQRVEMGERGFLQIRRVNARPEHGQMMLSDLRAVDMVDPGSRWMQLIDEEGCVTNPAIVEAIHRKDVNRLQVAIKFSGFPDKAHVSYQAVIRRCQFGCEQKCNQKYMVGQELREKDNDDNNDSDEENEANEPVRLHRRAIPSPTDGPKRHFQLDEDLFQVQTSHLAVFTESPNTDKQIEASGQGISAYLRISDYFLPTLLMIGVFLLLALCVLRYWLRNMRMNFSFFHLLYAKIDEYGTEPDETEQMHPNANATNDGIQQNTVIEESKPSGHRR